MNGTNGDRLEANTVVAHRYRVIRYLGDRGFGQIYQAEDAAIETDVVVMRLDKEFSHPRVRESFFETRGGAQVQDPRVVDLIDYGEDLDGRLFLVMPWIEDAQGLDEVVARTGGLSWSRAKYIVAQLAEALVAAHEKGILHGGLALNRVLLDPDDGVHIVDFGLAPALHRPGGRVVTNVSPLPRNTAYLSPEQVRGEPVDARSDVYALGIMLWELVAGEPPFMGDPIAVANAHLERPLPELARHGAPAELEALLHLALAKASDERIASAEEFSSLIAAMPDAAEASVRPALGKPKPKPKPKPKLAVAPPPTPASKPRRAPATSKPAPAPAASKPAPPPAASKPAPAPVASTPPPAPVASTPAPPPATARPAPEPEADSAAIPTPIDIPESAARPTPAAPPPATKRRLGKLELAILIVLGFNILVFAGWKLFGGSTTDPAKDDAVAEVQPAKPEPAKPEPAVVPAPASEGEAPEADEPSDPAPPDDDQDSATPTISVHEAIASEFPEEPAGPGPVRPMNQELSDTDFREAMVDARDKIVERCLDTRMRRTFKIQLKVAPEGKVTYNRVLGDQSDTELGRCIVKQVYGIGFPATHEGGTHVYTLRLR